MKKEILESRFDELVLDFCYSRELCRGIGVDYNNVGREEVKKIRDYLLKDYIIIPQRDSQVKDSTEEHLPRRE